MSNPLQFRNRQRVCAVDLRLLRQITRHLIAEHFQAARFELCLHLVAAEEMACLNESFLQHEGSTDVITFDYVEKAALAPRRSRTAGTALLHGEIFICLDDAVAQARQFRTTWQSELARYVIHGLLHLAGYDDLEPAARRIMKREESRLLRQVAQRFTLARLGSRQPSRPAIQSAI